MNPGGDAAEQVVRLSLEGVEVAARISGNGAKNIALLLYAALKEEKKTKGKARLTNMLKSGKELKVYTITNKDLAKFSQEAKRYGVLYCVLKDRNNKDPNAAVDVIARAEDASKIQRITERFRLATVDKADVSLDVQRDKDRIFPKDNNSVREALSGGHPEGLLEGQPDPERTLPPIDDAERSAGRRIMGEPRKEEQEVNPSLAKTDRDHLSAPSSTQADRSSGYRGKTERPSVREKLEVYKAEIALAKRERAKDVVSKGIEAAKDAAKAVPIPRAPGKER
ncbi:MAG: PcfB family protein [Mogibacterium sp.]|nr:PcfB family protein [Mogibacterium sp.]